MPQSSPLRTAQAKSVSVCGKLLQNGQSITVAESAIGPRERKMAERKKILIRSSNKSGQVQILCTLE